MSRKILFVERDGCLIDEPADQQIDSYEKLSLLPGVIAALQRVAAAGYELVMVTNQDGLGTESFPQQSFDGPHALLMRIFSSQGVHFRDVLIDRSFPQEGLDTRKPGVGMMRGYLADDSWSRAESAMVGDRDSDLQFAANMGVRGFRVGPEGSMWSDVAHQLLDRPRVADITRHTKETRIRVHVDLDHVTDPSVSTGLGFFDHMLEQIGKHGGFTLKLMCDGDTKVDEHHTIEDSALALGQALRQALGDKRGLARYGFTLPMDESQASAALDLSGRPYFVFEGHFPRERVGDVPTELVPHFFRSLCDALGANLHLAVKGENTHHMVEACFKATARALRQAIRREGDELPSTKGAL
jgi:imidazoleglycerol-phosphate dehydratase / histidinol-phosphatase